MSAKSFREIIKNWPERDGLTPLQAFCADLGINYVTGQVMSHRNSIDPDHFPGLVKAAGKRRVRGITLEHLHFLRAHTRERVA